MYDFDTNAKYEVIPLYIITIHKITEIHGEKEICTFLAPMCQIQQGSFGLLFNICHFEGFGHIDDEYDWVVGYGIVLCVEMMICSVFIAKYAFQPRDLRLWCYSESIIKPELSVTGNNSDDFVYGIASNKQSVNN